MSDVVETIRYAQYIEEKHQDFLMHVVNQRELLLEDSPYAAYENIDLDAAFMSAGFLLADLGTLCRTFGTFMQGLDPQNEYARWFNYRMAQAELDEPARADMEVDIDSLYGDIVGFKLAMRDANAVGSSTYITGISLIECDRLKKYAVISGENKFNAIHSVYNDISDMLNWNKNVVMMHGLLLKFYYLSLDEIRSANSTLAHRDKLWPLMILDYERAALAAMATRAPFDKTITRERSELSKMLFVLSYTVQGASFGYQVGGPYGAAAGAAVGSNIGFAAMMSEGKGSGSFTKSFIKVWGLQTLATIDPISAILFYKIFF